MYRSSADAGKVSQYQRAVTPTIEPSNSNNNNSNSNAGNISSNISVSPSVASNGGIRGKILSYNAPPTRSNLNRNTAQMLSATSNSINTSFPSNNLYRNSFMNTGSDMSVQGTKSGPHRNSLKSSDMTSLQEQLAALSMMPKYDLTPLSDDIPSDGIIFAKVRHNSMTNVHQTVSPDTLVVFRTAEERLRNPERLNLDRRQLEYCPLLEQEQRLRLLNYQNNNIKYITNLENLPNLIFLDLYNNKIITLEGPLNQVRGLRVLMAGKNKINRITNLNLLKKLDVLDLHSNEIKSIEGLDGLSDLRVLNLAGNKISIVDNLQSLSSLTELNLRRNSITHIYGLHNLPALQRIFLSHNQIAAYVDIQCIFNISSLKELSLDNNPIAEKEGPAYRYTILAYVQGLKHLDLKRVTDEERSLVTGINLDTHMFALGKANDELRDGNSHSTSAGQEDRSDSPHTVDNRSVNDASVNTSRAPSAQGKGGEEDRSGLDDVENEDGQEMDQQNDNYSASPLPPSAEANGANEDLFEAKTGGGLAALARSGRITSNQNLFDIEILGPDEKVLIASGDKWDMNIPRKLLSSITEVCLLHIRREQITQRFNSSVVANMTSLKTLRFLFNDFHTIKHVDFIPQLFGVIEQLHVKENPLNNQTQTLLQSYLIAHMPKLNLLNDESVTSAQRVKAEKYWKPIDDIKSKTIKLFANKAAINASNNAIRANESQDGDNGIELSFSRDDNELQASRSRPVLSSLASLLRSNTSHANTLSGGLSLGSSQVNISLPWQTTAKLTISYEKFSRDFDSIVLDIVKESVSEVRKQQQEW